MKPLKIVKETGLEGSQADTLAESYRFNDYRRYRSVDATACKKYFRGVIQEILACDEAHSWLAYRGDSLVGIAAVTPLAWDSSYFGLPMANLTVIIIEDEPIGSFEIADKLLNKALPEVSNQQIQHLSVRVDIEETGLIDFQLFGETIFDLDIHQIPTWKDVSAHLHYDVRFLVHADSKQAIHLSSESNDLAWFKLHRLAEITTDDSVLRLAEKTAG